MPAVFLERPFRAKDAVRRPCKTRAAIARCARVRADWTGGIGRRPASTAAAAAARGAGEAMGAAQAAAGAARTWAEMRVPGLVSGAERART